MPKILLDLVPSLKCQQQIPDNVSGGRSMGQITRDDEQLSIRTAVGSGCELHICSLKRYVLYVFAYSGSEAITSAKAACGSSRVIGPRSCPCRSEEHKSEFQSLIRISYAVFFFKKKY